MSSPDDLTDFSHLPTVDEAAVDHDGASALWQKHRRAKEQQVQAPPEAAPQPEPEVAPSSLLESEDWQALLEMEPEELPCVVKKPTAPIVSQAPEVKVVKRSTIRPKSAAPPIPEVTEEPVPEVSSPEPAVVDEPVKQEATTAEEKAPVPEGGEVKDTTKPASDEAPPAKEGVKVEEAAVPKKPWQHRWEKIGGSALALSVGAHLLLLAGAAVYVVNQAMESQVDFLPGGGTAQQQAASQDLQHKIQQKKNPWLKKSIPMRKIAALDKVSDIVLPESIPDLLDLPSASNPLTSKLGAGMGLAGSSGGFGKGMGLGSKSGMVFQPLSMFGKEIKAKKLAVILDVSASMAPHLPHVIAEVDRVAKGSVVVLFVGCGLEQPPPQGLDGEEVFRTAGQEFEKFWRMGGASLEDARKFKFNPKDPIPNEEIFRMLARRPQTFFIHEVQPNTVGYTWLALLSNEVRSADALYWFSDFQDSANFRQIGIVRENLLNRKQKLYIHAYQRGSAFDLINSQLVEPTGGDVIEEVE